MLTSCRRALALALMAEQARFQSAFGEVFRGKLTLSFAEVALAGVEGLTRIAKLISVRGTNSLERELPVELS